MGKRNVRTIESALGKTIKHVASPPIVMRGIQTGDGLENVMAGLGTDRDKRRHAHYNYPRPLTRYDLENMFRSSHISKRIVCAPADDMTREWREFKFDDDDDNPMLEALEQAEIAFCVKAKFREAMYWARLYGGAMIIIGLADAISTSDMLMPLDVNRVKKGDLKYLHVVDRWRCAPSGKICYDITSPNFGLPETYIFSESSVEIHWTRVLRFNGQKLPYFSWQANGMWDDSELQHVYDSVMDYDAAQQSVSSMLYEANIDVVSSEGLTDLLATANGEQKLIKRFQLGQMMKSFNRTLILDAKEKYEKKHNTFSNIDNILREKKSDVSGASQIALSILFGEQAGGLQSGGDDDLRNYYDFCVKERDTKMTPQVDYFDQIFVRAILGQMPKGYGYDWNSLWQIDDMDQATIDWNNAQRDQIYLNTGVVTEGLVASELKRRGTYASMSSEDVALAEELGEQMDDHDAAMRDQAENPPKPNGPLDNKTAPNKKTAVKRKKR